MRGTTESGKTERRRRGRQIAVLLVEHDRLGVQMLERVLDRPGMRLAGVAESGQEAIERARSAPPDVLVLSTHLADLKPIVVACRLRRAGCRVPILWLIDRDADRTLLQAVLVGVKGFVARADVTEQLPRAILALAQGGAWIDRRLAARLIDLAAEVTLQMGVDPTALATLTDRELQAIKFAASGLTIGAMADRMEVSESAVKQYLRGAREKLGLSSRAEAVTAVICLAPFWRPP